MCSDAWSGLHFNEFKGLENIKLKEEYKYLDPIAGCAFSKQPLMVNLYNYSNLDSKNKGDPSERLIQSLFNSAPGNDDSIAFQTSPLAKKFGTFLGPSTRN